MIFSTNLFPPPLSDTISGKVMTRITICFVEKLEKPNNYSKTSLYRVFEEDGMAH